MRFTVVIPSYLGDYRTAAKDRDKKLVRAVNSILTQTFQDFEIIVIADGCEKTVEIMSGFKDKRIRTFLTPKQPAWTGQRNKGLDEALGEYIVYLDVDDVFGENHLQNISNGLDGYDWVWFNDIRYSPKLEQWYENKCNIRMIGAHGTSNVCHRASLPYRWDHKGYAHDYYFIKHLKRNTNFTKIPGGEYYVCHLPNSTLGKGYDI